MWTVSRLCLRILLVLNIAAAVAFVAILIATVWPLAPRIEHGLAFRFPQVDPHGLLAIMRLVLLIGLLTAGAAHLIFRRLLAIIATAAAGDPFTAANGERLRVIAWALLAIQILDLGFGGIYLAMDPALGLDWSFSLGGWIAVLMLFVLARVFEQGSRMRDELAMTV